MHPIKLFRGWYLCKDTGIPLSYPPKAEEELVYRRMEMYYMQKELFELKYPNPVTRMDAIRKLTS